MGYASFMALAPRKSPALTQPHRASVASPTPSLYANEEGEPAHIHVQRDQALAKFWLKPVALVQSRGFAAHEQRTIGELVEANAGAFLEAWNEFFPA